MLTYPSVLEFKEILEDLVNSKLRNGKEFYVYENKRYYMKQQVFRNGRFDKRLIPVAKVKLFNEEIWLNDVYGSLKKETFCWIIQLTEVSNFVDFTINLVKESALIEGKPNVPESGIIVQ